MVTALRAYLILIVLANVGGMLALGTGLDELMSRYPDLSNSMAVILFACGAGSVIAAVLIWRWSRTGVLLITVSYSVMLLVNLVYGAPLAHTMLGPIGLAVLLALLWPLRGRFTPPKAP